MPPNPDAGARGNSNLPPDIRGFASAEQADAALAATIETRLRAALASRGRASLVVSGGTTPRRLYERLSALRLDWKHVCIVLADERWVAPGTAGSNETFIRTTLLQNAAAAASFLPLKTSHPSPLKAESEVSLGLSGCPRPFDIVVLGMGSDGHTLSWFPDAAGLDMALETGGPLAAAIFAHPSAVTGPHAERMILTRAALKDAGLVALLLRGEEKRAVLKLALEPGPVSHMPIRALLRDPAVVLEVDAA